MHSNKGEHSNCILCGSDELIPLDRYSAAHLCQCLKCDLVFSSVIPSERAIDEFQINQKWKEHITEDTQRRYSHLLDRFEHFRKNGRLLDLDCSHGEFLEMAKKRGWEVVGTADRQDALKICRDKGLEMVEGTFNLDGFSDEHFDIVCARNLFEHIANPNEELVKLNRILRSGGLIYATTLNFNSYLRFRLREKYAAISYPLRLVYYSRATFKKLFKQNGFKILETEASGVSIGKRKIARARIEVPITEESDFIEWDENRESSFSRFQRRNLAPVFSFFGIGDFLKGWFVKS